MVIKSNAVGNSLSGQTGTGSFVGSIAPTISSLTITGNLAANNFLQGYATTVTSAGTTTLTVSSAEQQYFTGTTTHSVVMPVTSTLVLGQSFTIVNKSTGVVRIKSSGPNTIQDMVGGSFAVYTCILTSGTTAASWSTAYSEPNLAITTINGDSGSISGTTVAINAGFGTNLCGGTVEFVSSGATSQLHVTDASHNTYVGSLCASNLLGNHNTAFGDSAMVAASGTPTGNCAFGNISLQSVTGVSNSGFGTSSLSSLLGGNYNTGCGFGSGSNYTGTETYNIMLGANVAGTLGESFVTRIGFQKTGSTGQDHCFIAGIAGGTFAGGSAPAITLVNTNDGQLISTATGTGVVTALGVNVGTSGSVVVNGGALGTPSSGNLTNCTGIPGQSSILGVSSLSGTIADLYLSFWTPDFGGATPTIVNMVMPIAGTITKLYVNVTTNSDAGSRNITVFKNSSASALTVSSTASTTAVLSDLTHTATFAIGDKVCFLVSSGSGAFAATITCVFTPI